MATRILGIELGSYSVKVAVATSGFRQSSIVDFLEQRVPDGDAPFEERAARVAGEIVRAAGLHHDVPYVAFPGDAVSIRVLDFPFSGLKRVDLDKAVGAELEAQLPHDLDELTYDFDTLPRDLDPHASAVAEPAFVDGAAAGRPEEKRPAAHAGGTRVLTAATTRERVAAMIAALGAQGIEPRALVVAPTVYARAAEKLAALGGPEAKNDAVLILDHGHTRTNVAVVLRGRIVYARTLSRGGRHVTQSIARAWNLSFDDAERAKHADGFVSSQRLPAATDAWERISHVIKGELAPLVRDLRQTLAACRAQAGVTIRRGVLTGGGARLNGLAEFLAEELGIPLGAVTDDDKQRLFAPALAARVELRADVALVSAAVAFEGAAGRAMFDLRKGDLAYKADFSFLRAKAGVLAACTLVVIAFAALNAYASLYKLNKERDLLEDQLKTATTEVFDEPVSLEDLEARLQPAKEQSPLPKSTAYDQLVEISKRLPPRAEVKLDVSEIEIDTKRIVIKGVAESSAAIDLVEKKLRDVECFTEIQRGKIDSVAEGKQLTLTIPTKCM